MQATLSASTIRNLGQKEYEKRKQAALEVENLVREHRDAGDFEKIRALVLQYKCMSSRRVRSQLTQRSARSAFSSRAKVPQHEACRP